MHHTITLYHNPHSRSQMARWMLEEVGVPYDVKLIRFDRNEHKTPEFLNINPMGKLPTLVHRGVTVSEAAAIIAYLADAFPDASLAPKLSDPARGTYLRWLFFAAGCIEPAVIDHAFKRPPVKRAGALGYGSYAETIDAAEAAVTPGPWILGERFSAADVYLGGQLNWGLQLGTIEARPAFKAYTERCRERPAYIREMALDAALGERLKED